MINEETYREVVLEYRLMELDKKIDASRARRKTAILAARRAAGDSE